MQNAPDGVNREQAVAYQQFVLDFQLLCLLAGKANGQWFSADYESRLESMLDYLASIMDAGGNVPMFGDADDGFAVRLAPQEGFCPYKSLLATGALLFRRGDFRQKARTLDDKTRWLFGATRRRRVRSARRRARRACRSGKPSPRAATSCSAATSTRPARSAWSPMPGRSATARSRRTATPTRSASRFRPAAWSSSSIRAPTRTTRRSAGGITSAAPPRTTRCASTRSTSRCPAATSCGSRKARAGCSLWLSSPEKDSFEGWHDGYMRLDDPVKHRRLIELDKRARRVLVEDTLEMGEEHDVELFFHCHEDCTVDAIAGGYLIARAGTSLRLLLPQVENAESSVHRGSVAPLLGWVSRAFDSRRPAPTIAWRARLANRAVLRTEILISP